MNRIDALRREMAPTLERLVRRCGDDMQMCQTVRAAANNFIEALMEAHPAESGAPQRPYLTRCLSRFVSALIEALSEGPPVGFAPSTRHPRASNTKPIHPVDWEEADEAEITLGRHWLPEALACLEDETRQVFIWRYFEERSLTDIACWLETSETAVHARLQRTLASLRQELPTDATLHGTGGTISLVS